MARQERKKEDLFIKEKRRAKNFLSQVVLKWMMIKV